MDHNKLQKILEEMGIQHHLTRFLRTCTQVKKQQLELDIEQRTGSKLGLEYVKAIRCHPVYLTYADDTALKAENEEELKSLLMKVKEESEKPDLKLNLEKNKIMASSPITSWQIDGKQ